MSCYHKRLSITLNDKEVLDYVEMYSKQKNNSLSSSVQELLKIAIEHDEDIYWSKIADEAFDKAQGKTTISAEEVWKNNALI